MIWLLFILLCFFTHINFKISGLDLFNPAVVVSGVFAIFSFLCCLANIFIGIDINNITTIITICTGIFIFTIINYVRPCNYEKFIIENQKKYSTLSIGIIGYIGILIIIAAIYVNYSYIMAVAAAYGVGSDFFESMVKYKIITTFHTTDNLVPSPWYRGLLNVMAASWAYFCIYLFMQNKILNNDYSVLYGLSILLYIVYSLMGGARSETFRIITAIMFMWYLFSRSSRKERFNTKFVLRRLVIIISIVSFLFIVFVYAVGRSQADMDFEAVIMAMFIYAGAPIFNLDIFLDNPWKATNGIWGEMTFIRLINWLGVKFDIPSWRYELDLPFLSYQNYGLGNVYTTFYAFLYDFGYVGVIVLTGVMALVCAFIYNRVKHANVLSNKISFTAICYAYLVNDIIMLPFSNRFYENVGNVSALYKVLVVYTMVYIANRLLDNKT